MLCSPPNWKPSWVARLFQRGGHRPLSEDVLAGASRRFDWRREQVVGRGEVRGVVEGPRAGGQADCLAAGEVYGRPRDRIHPGDESLARARGGDTSSARVVV
jgi:hypothetical protein